MDRELREAIRERDARPGDPDAALKAAQMIARRGTRDEAAEAFQEVLRRDLAQVAARAELDALGCELVFVAKNEKGYEEYESAVDGAILVRVPQTRTRLFQPAGRIDVAPFFVAKEPVTYARFQSFLVKNPLASREEIAGWINLARGPLRRGVLGSWRLHQGAAQTYVHDVTWTGARAYARWAHGDLPTQAQWELAIYGAREEPPDGAPPAPSPFGVAGADAFARLGFGEWTLDLVSRLGVEQRVIRGGTDRVATFGGPITTEPRVTPADPRAPIAGFRYVRDSWWKS